LEALPAGHAHLAKVSFAGGQVSQRVVQADAPAFEVEQRAGFWAAARRFLVLGIEHIFTGYDHIAFLIGLLLLGGSFKELVQIVTAFTVAHSITLALATLAIVNPTPRIIEPLIAASIVYVAAENLWALRRGTSASALRHRWMLTFAFGLVHGFGFATVLRELHLPRSGLAAALVTFNLGVEVGQVCIVALAVPLLAALRRTRWFEPLGVRLDELALREGAARRLEGLDVVAVLDLVQAVRGLIVAVLTVVLRLRLGDLACVRAGVVVDGKQRVHRARNGDQRSADPTSGSK